MTVGIRSQRINYAEDTGSQDNLSVAYDPPLTSYTEGLTLHVRVKFTNAGACSINAGPGNAPIKKMNGADLNEGELPSGAVATLIFDGSKFQLTNFGGGLGTAGDVFTVNIPYAIDTSIAANTVIANFGPPALMPPTEGDVVAVKINNTNNGATHLQVPYWPQPYELKPNGGGGDPALQGDLHKDDIVILFFDGTAFWFTPNPEIDADITYSIGPSGKFTSLNQAMEALKRKTIGAKARVTLQFAQGTFAGPLNVQHPDGDRLTVCGTMKTAPPTFGDFQHFGITAAQLAQAAVLNKSMLESRYGTIITIPQIAIVGGQSWGIRNDGSGSVAFRDLLIMGNQLPANNPVQQNGLHLTANRRASCSNVSVFGAHYGFNSFGGFYCDRCFATACAFIGFAAVSGVTIVEDSAAFDNRDTGFGATFGSIWGLNIRSQFNASAGVYSGNSSGVHVHSGSVVLNNGIDLYAVASSSLIFQRPGNFASAIPLQNTVGNGNSYIADVG